MLLSGCVTSPAPAMPAEMAMLLAWKWALLSTFTKLIVPFVVKLLLFVSMAFCELVIAPPFKVVLPVTLTVNPPSPARMALCSVTLTYSLTIFVLLLDVDPP